MMLNILQKENYLQEPFVNKYQFTLSNSQSNKNANQIIYNKDCLKNTSIVKDNFIDLIICDGPYNSTNHKWDRIKNIQEYNFNLIKLFSPKLKEGGAFYLFGKSDCLDFIDYRPYLKLQSKIIWYQPSRLSQGKINYTNNYDMIYYFTKGDKPRTFNLNDIRIPQMVELAHRLRCENVPSVKNGKYNKTKFNDKGKNPGNVWGDIKQLTYKSKELISKELLNTIQKPKALIERMILANTNENDFVLDPFCGVGTSYVLCKELNRNFIGFEINKEYIELSYKREK